MSKTVSVFFHRSRPGLIFGGALFALGLAFTIYYTWIEPRDDADFIIKFLAPPHLLLISFYCFKTAFTKDSKIVVLKVGEKGVWRRVMSGKVFFYSWNEISSITIEEDRYDKRLKFLLKDLKQYPFLQRRHGHIYLSETVSALPLEKLAQKFCQFRDFESRYNRPLGLKSHRMS